MKCFGIQNIPSPIKANFITNFAKCANWFAIAVGYTASINASFMDTIMIIFGVVAFPGTLWNRQKIKWTYPRLHTTHPLDFWYMNRYCQYLFPYPQSSAWVVCRRSYVHFIFWRFRSVRTHNFNWFFYFDKRFFDKMLKNKH